MNILICPDKFKSCLTAPEVASCLLRGFKKSLSYARYRMVPLADGGEGFTDIMVSATQGSIFETIVHDPLMRKIPARYGILGNKPTAVIEMSEASGLSLLDPAERNPMLATTFGTGELIRDALNKGCSEVIIGIGGSATIDGGVGMAMALGWGFMDQSGKDIGFGGHSLGKLVSINRTQVDRRLEVVKITAACDVTNVLTGAEGAAKIYGLQKGATEGMIEELDTNLAHLAAVVRQQLHTEIQDIEGSGAAGGMGAGIVAFLGGKLSRGFDLVSAALNLEQFMNWADVVITAEGKIDAQTAFGKTTGGVAKMAAGMKKPVIAFCGALDADIHSPASLGFQAIIPIADRPMTLTESISEAGRLLEAAGERVGKLLALQIINQFPA